MKVTATAAACTAQPAQPAKSIAQRFFQVYAVDSVRRDDLLLRREKKGGRRYPRIHSPASGQRALADPYPGYQVTYANGQRAARAILPPPARTSKPFQFAARRQPMNEDKITVLRADLARPEHQKATLELLNAYAMDPMGDGQPLSESARRDLIPGLRQHPTTLVFLAYRDAEPVGLAICFRGFSTFAAPARQYFRLLRASYASRPRHRSLAPRHDRATRPRAGLLQAHPRSSGKQPPRKTRLRGGGVLAGHLRSRGGRSTLSQ